MAKKKLNLDKDAAKHFFIQHGEKLLFGLAIGLIGLFVWMGMKTPKFSSTTPDQLYQTANVTADSYINDSKNWDKISEYRFGDPYTAERIANNAETIKPENYLYGSLSGSIFASRGLREDPEFVPIKTLETEFIRTQIATRVEGKNAEKQLMINTNSLEDVDGGLGKMKYWMFAYRPVKAGLNEDSAMALTYDVVAGIALVPLQDQIDAYQENFSSSIGFHKLRDKPIYKFLEIQRSEDGGETWNGINAEIDEYFKTFFAEPAKEVIDKKYVVEDVTNPIPPFLSFDYREAAGSDETPMARLISDEMMNADKEEEQEESFDSMFDRKTNKKEVTLDQAKEKEDEVQKYKLARFYDPTPKEVGKTYQYRVRLWIADPNSKDLEALVKKDTGRQISFGGGGEGMQELREGARDRKKDDNGEEISEEDQFWIDNPPEPIFETMLHEDVRRRQRTAKYEYPVQDLEDGETYDLKGLIPTDWSNISSVTVPQNYARFYTGPIKAPNRVTSRDGKEYFNEEYEPAAKLVTITKAPKIELSIPIVAEEAYRGSILNLNQAAKFLHPITWRLKELDEFSYDDETPMNDRKRKDPKGLFYQTDALVVDLMGGEKLPFSKSGDNFNMPSEVLVMDSSGRLIVRNELDDATNYRISTFMGDEDEPDAARRKKEEERKKKEDEGKNDDGGGLDGPG